MQREVDHYAILAPDEVRAAVVLSRERFEQWMSAEFPGVRFTLLAPVREINDDDEVVVVPMMGSVGGTISESNLRALPSRAVIRAIADRVLAFEARPRLN